MKGIMRFQKKGKLSPRFIDPFEVLERVGEVAYMLALPPILLGVHLVFHVSMLQRYYVDRFHVLDYNTVHLDESLGYEEEPLAIVDRQARKLRSKKISVVKVKWRGQPAKEVTLNTKENKRSRYPHLFGTSVLRASLSQTLPQPTVSSALLSQPPLPHSPVPRL
ncbi:uncharacterized protein [Nicotiana tomentosiformis]|uniref:uncharacterized protein n=1 Tax=Nicotiana tomentosiformis TaxID=4098 RepID=UPI00388CA6F6